MGRTAGGVTGIKLRKEDYVITARTVDKDRKDLYNLTITEKGHGKKTNLTSFGAQNRGGKGLIAAKVTAKTGDLVDSIIVENKGDVLLTSAEGQAIRLSVKKIPTLSRSTQGVILIRFKGDDILSSIALIEEEKESEK